MTGAKMLRWNYARNPVTSEERATMAVSLLTIATAGSVDDGKSTLIGRLLYETGSLSLDRLAQIEDASRKTGKDGIDFSLVADGLSAEREQRITIDVAHLYFSTAQCNFIIADTPGHFEYTRNMVTGASRADVMVMLIDARHGVKEQSLRHLYLAGLLRLRNVVVAVNKMDLVDWSETRFNNICAELQAWCQRFGFSGLRLHGIPVSSLKGDNLTTASARMPWFRGLPLLELLERFAESRIPPVEPMRFMVQGNIRLRSEDGQEYRGISGRLYGDQLQVGNEVVVLPSLMKSRIKDIQFAGHAYAAAAPGSSCTLLLEDELDVARGNLLVRPGQEPLLREHLRAMLCHFSARPLQPGQRYLLQAGTLRIKVVVLALEGCMQADFCDIEPKALMRMNDIGVVCLKPEIPLYLDEFGQCRHTGSFILIDEATCETCAVGLVRAG